jgi:hypothetical protein
MKTATYETIQTLAADLAGIPRDKLPPSEAEMLRAFFASELPDLWNREAWPELCDHLEEVTLDANNCFSLREGAADEMGDILAILIGGNPRLTTQVEKLPRSQWTRLDNRVNVITTPPGGGIWVEWQSPAPDLLDNTALGIASDDDLADYELPARFKLPLAYRGAALLLSDEDPQKAAALRGAAEVEVQRQAQRLERPWWRA